MYGSSKSDENSDVAKFDAKEGLTLKWAIVVDNGVAYWYINGVLVQKFDSPKLQSFNIGALQMDVVLYDINITKAGDALYEDVLAGYPKNA